MTQPIIGITTYGRDAGNRFSLPAEYVDSVRRAGARTVLLPPGESDTTGWLSVVDGVVLAGGGDFDPALYDGSSHDSVYMIDHERDRSELDMARRLIDARKPTLGICRGAQAINLACGGTLHVHLPDVYGDAIQHRLPPREPTPHAVRVEEGSQLATLLGALELEAASWHHQAIDRVAPGFRVVARAPDGVVEAIEKPEHPWLIAVQWHPELTAATDPLQQGIFDRFVAAAAARRRG